MLNAMINFEDKCQVEVSLEDFFNEFVELDSYDVYFDKITDLIYDFDNSGATYVSHPNETLFFIECDDKKIANKVEYWLNKKFEVINMQLVEELEENM